MLIQAIQITCESTVFLRNCSTANYVTEHGPVAGIIDNAFFLQLSTLTVKDEKVAVIDRPIDPDVCRNASFLKKTFLDEDTK